MGGACSTHGKQKNCIKFFLKENLIESGGEDHGLDLSGSGYEQMAGTCKCSNKPSGSLKLAVFLTS